MSVIVRLAFCPIKEATLVEVASSCNDWTKVPMNKDSSDSEWSIFVKLDPGSHQYKYIVDGDWVVDSELPTVDDNLGGLNNLIKIAGDLSDDDLQFLVETFENSEEAVKNYYKLFKLRHPTGYITYKEYKKMALVFFREQMDCEARADATVKYGFSMHDTDHNGVLSFREVAHCLYVTRLEGGSNEARIRAAFRMYDLDRKGVIGKKELSGFHVSLVALMGEDMDRQAIDEECTNIMNKLDTNFDDVISEEEFVKGCLKDEELFDDFTSYSAIMNEVIRCDLDKLKWNQEMGVKEEDFKKIKSGLKLFCDAPPGADYIDSEHPTVDNKITDDLSDEDLQFLVKTTEKSEESVKNYYKLFKLRHSSGFINYDEYKKMANAFFCEHMNREARADAMAKYGFSIYDTEHNGVLSFREVAHCLYVTRHQGGSDEAKIRAAFRMYDLDRKGVIGKKELCGFHASLMSLMGDDDLEPCDRREIDNEARKIIYQLDTNFDDVISEEEFVKGCLEDAELFEDFTIYSALMNEIIRSDLAKLKWNQEMGVTEEDFKKIKSELKSFCSVPAGAEY